MTNLHWTTQLSIAHHEAAHAIAAQYMGLRVSFVSIEGVESEGDIYLAATGIEIEGEDERDNMKLALAVDLSQHPQLKGVCVSMAMPANCTIPSDPFYAYSVMEYRQALDMAERGGIDTDEIDRLCDEIQDEKWEEILALGQRLRAEGRVEFAHTT